MTSNMTIGLRPHHFLCLPGYKGNNYNQNQVSSWNKISKQLRDNPDTDILIISGKDELCSKCPNTESKNSSCREKAVSELDNKVKFLTGIETGKTYKFSEIMRRMKWVMTPEIHKELCSECAWWKNGMCHDTFSNENKLPFLSVTSNNVIDASKLKYNSQVKAAA